MGNYTPFLMFENPRRGRQARNFTENDPKILDLKSSSEQIIFRKLSLGAPDLSSTSTSLKESVLIGQCRLFNYFPNSLSAVFCISSWLPQHLLSRLSVPFIFLFPYMCLHVLSVPTFLLFNVFNALPFSRNYACLAAAHLHASTV